MTDDAGTSTGVLSTSTDQPHAPGSSVLPGPRAGGPGSTDSDPLPAARAPVGVATVAVIAIVVAVLVTALGVMAVRDALVAAGASTGSPWLTGALGGLNGITPTPWSMALGILLFVIGVWLVLQALRPRPRTGLAVRATTGVFLRPADVSRLAAGAATDVDGVLDAKASATTKRVSVHLITTGDSSTQEQVHDAVARRLGHLDPVPRVQVRSRTEGRARQERQGDAR